MPQTHIKPEIVLCMTMVRHEGKIGESMGTHGPHSLA